MNNRDAFTKGRRQALITLCETLAAQLDTTEAQIHAQLAAQYRAALKELEELTEAEPDEGGGNGPIKDEPFNPY